MPRVNHAGWRGAALLLFLLLISPAVSQAGLFGKDANDGKERDAYSRAESGESWTRIEAEVTVDGQKQTYHFTKLYNLIAWLFTQDAKGHKLAWPPVVRMREWGESGQPRMVELPFGALTPDQEQGLILTAMPGDPHQSFGPWMVTTDFKLLSTTFPNYVLYTDLEAAAKQAANWHGALYHWDDAALKLAALYRTLDQAGGGGGGSFDDSGDISPKAFRIEVPPSVPPPPMVIPGGEDEMKQS